MPQESYEARRERFEYIRNWVVLGLGVAVVVVILVAVIIADIGDQAIVLALLGFAGTILGVPFASAIDRARERRNGK